MANFNTTLVKVHLIYKKGDKEAGYIFQYNPC